MIILIDEAHNLKSTDDKSQYSSIHRFLHKVKNCKILLMTATPMRDGPDEIASLLNLILPLNEQMPEGQDFIEEYMKPQGESFTMIPNMIPNFKKYIQGRVSYLSSMQSRVKREYIGNRVLNYFNLYQSQLEPFQLKIYKEAFEYDTSGGEATKGRGVYNNSRQASLFVFPDGSYGEKGFKQYIEEKEAEKKLSILKDRKVDSYFIKESLKKEFVGTLDEKLKKLRTFSAKYADCFELLLKNKENHFVFIELVEGGGAVLFSLLLELFGFSRYFGGKAISKKLRYAIISSKTSTPKEIRDVLETYNSPQNMNGELIRVIIGSKIIGEGFSLKNVQSIHILTTWWNFGQTEQAIGRGIRLFSHKDLEEAGVNVLVKIYLNSVKTGDSVPSIDELMYKTGEDKDISIKSVEHVIKEAAFDCALNRERNILPSNLDGFRECDYTTCDYKCDNVTQEEIDNPEVDTSTYNLYYDEKDVQKVKENIKDLFKTKRKIHLSEIKMVPSGPFTILKTINELVSSNYIIPDMFGFKTVIRYNNEYIYQTYDLGRNGSKESNIFSNYYTEYFPLQEYVNFENLITNTVSDNYPNILEMMKKEQNNEKMTELFKKFTLKAQELMLEFAITSSETNPNSNCESIKKYVISKLSEFVIKIPNDSKIVSTLLYDDSNILRCFDKNNKTWEDCDDTYNEKVKEMFKEKKQDLESNEYGYYGIYEDATGIFSIRDVSKPEYRGIGIKDTRKITKGLNCKISWTAEQLVRLVDHLKLDYNVDDPNVKKYNTKEAILNFIIGNADYKNVNNIFTPEELAQKSENDLKRLVYWGKKKGMKKETICDALKKWFTQNELLEVTVKK
jgi:hypothetical protein